MLRFVLFALCSCGLLVHSEEYTPKFDGILGAPVETISNLTQLALYFMPYNPIVLEAGAFEGANTENLARQYPKGHIFAFEPNPRAFKALVQNTESLPNVSAFNLALNEYNGNATLYLNRGVYANSLNQEEYSSLLPEQKGRMLYFKGPAIQVPCVTLDTWCKEQGIDHVDLIQLDIEGLELQVLKSSPKILKTILVICVKTNMASFRRGTTQFMVLKNFLEQNNFTMLGHWYRDGLQGEATFIQTRMYDALFK